MRDCSLERVVDKASAAYEEGLLRSRWRSRAKPKDKNKECKLEEKPKLPSGQVTIFIHRDRPAPPNQHGAKWTDQWLDAEAKRIESGGVYKAEVMERHGKVALFVYPKEI